MSEVTSHKFAVVTDASNGIGFELAKQFGEHGYDLLLAAKSDRIVDAAERLADLDVDVNYIQVDLAKREGVEELCREIRSTGRGVDTIAINASAGVSGDFARDTPLEAELNLIDLNVRSTVYLTKRIVADMVARGRGTILFTSFTAATPFDAVYGASKAFLQSFSQAIGSELKDTGVTVTTLMPGSNSAGKDDTEVAREVYESLAIRRGTRPARRSPFASAVSRLCS